MGRKNVVKSFKMFDSADISTNQTSEITNVSTLDKASIHLNWSGTAPVGVITVEARNGSEDSWVTLDLGASIDISGASGDHQLLFNEIPFTDIRLQYISTSGIGSLDARLTAKTIGA